MATAAVGHELVTGLEMPREEFFRLWDLLPDLKLAEFIDGIVYVAPPVTLDHGRLQSIVAFWLGCYASETPVCDCASHATWLMLESAPQPDGCLYNTPVRTERGLAVGAPELIVEVTLTSTSHDFGPKLALYQRAGVQEYITIEDVTRRVTWRALGANGYRQMVPDKDGLLKSKVFPGLWLDPAALFPPDPRRLRQVLEAGLASAEHARFVARQRRRKA